MISDNDKVYNIVLIEDDESDAELIELKIKKLDINTRTEVISEAEELKEILENRPPDLIISDYNLPGFTGIQALKIVRKRHRNLPFISVTGFLKEDEAVDMMLKGASDYVMKDQLERLGPAVVRELSNYSMRKNQEVSSRLIEAMFESSSVGIAAIDDNGNYVMVNNIFASMAGYDQEELIGMSIFDLNVSENLNEVGVKLKRVIEKGESHKGEWPLLRKDGLQLDVQSTLSKINYLGVHNMAISFVRDITEEKKLRREREEALDDLQERIKEQQCLYEISRLDELALSIDEMLSIAVKMMPGGFSYPEITEAEIQFGDKKYRTNKFKQTNKTLKTVSNRIKDKSLVINVVYSKKKPERDEGPFLYEERQLINSITDQLSLKIDRKLTQTELIRSREELQNIMDQSKDVICTVDREGSFIRVGAASEDIWGYKPDELAEYGFIELVYGDDREQTRDILNQIRTGVEITNFENRFVRKNGALVPMIWSMKWDKNARIAYCVARDATQIMETENRLKNLNRDLKIRAEELAASNAELERFAYVASHDLQEPLRMVSGFMELLEKKYKHQLDEKASQYIQFAVDGATRMRRIILDLLEYSRIGKSNIKVEKVDLNKLLSDVLQQYQSIIDEAGAQLIIPDLPVIRATNSSMGQIFQNLISNTLKYRHSERKPVIRIDCKELPTHWQFSVSDNGIGIETRYYDKVFDVFQRLHNKDEYSGTGIGLAICKKIVEKFDGEIWVDSDFPEGSTFYFTVRKNLEKQDRSTGR